MLGEHKAWGAMSLFFAGHVWLGSGSAHFGRTTDHPAVLSHVARGPQSSTLVLYSQMSPAIGQAAPLGGSVAGHGGIAPELPLELLVLDDPLDEFPDVPLEPPLEDDVPPSSAGMATTDPEHPRTANVIQADRESPKRAIPQGSHRASAKANGRALNV
jgi:hypothetical protein